MGAHVRPCQPQRIADLIGEGRHLVPLVITDEQLDEALDVLAESALAARGRGSGTSEVEGE